MGAGWYQVSPRPREHGPGAVGHCPTHRSKYALTQRDAIAHCVHASHQRAAPAAPRALPAGPVRLRGRDDDRDEHEPGRDVRQESDAVFVAPGSLDLDRLNDLLNFRPEEDTQSTTLGGLVSEWLGHVPQVGETVERDGVRFEVLAANDRRVDEVRISRVPTPTELVANS